MEKYKITKSIRFKLVPDKIQGIKKQVASLEDSSTKDSKKNNLLRLIQRGQELPKLLNEYIRYNDNHKLKSNITIHFRWLRLFTKDLYYNWKKDDTEKKIKINDIDYLSFVFERFIEEWGTTIERLNTDCNRPEESKTRNAEIALSIKRLGTRQLFPFIKSFVINSNDKNSEEIKSKMVALIDEFTIKFSIAEQDYLPSQSSGIVIAKASFNYYTINKKQKDFEAEISIVKKNLNSKYSNSKYDQMLRELGIINFKELSLIDFYSKIKNYKASQKSEFLETVSNSLAYSDLKSRFPLFQIESEKYAEFLKLTRKITEKSTAKSLLSKDSAEAQKLQIEIAKLKRNRGFYFKNEFKKYLKICELYKDIAVKAGKLKAQTFLLPNSQTTDVCF
jgi:hypothetical protein